MRVAMDALGSHTRWNRGEIYGEEKVKLRRKWKHWRAFRLGQGASGSKITCKTWQTEAALRMLMNNLDSEVAEKRLNSSSMEGLERLPETGGLSFVGWMSEESRKWWNIARPIGQTRWDL